MGHRQYSSRKQDLEVWDRGEIVCKMPAESSSRGLITWKGSAFLQTAGHTRGKDVPGQLGLREAWSQPEPGVGDVCSSRVRTLASVNVF